MAAVALAPLGALGPPGWIFLGVVTIGAIAYAVYQEVAEPCVNCLLQEDAIDCEQEWDDAMADCEKMLSQPNPPRGITGGYGNIRDCARGLVPEICGGNPIS